MDDPSQLPGGLSPREIRALREDQIDLMLEKENRWSPMRTTEPFGETDLEKECHLGMKCFLGDLTAKSSLEP